MFASWALSTWALAVAIWSQLDALGGRIALALLIAAGVGEGMASVFDINHPLHNLAGIIGVLSLPIAAVLTSLGLGRTQTWSGARKALLWTANLTWISLVLMLVSLTALVATSTRAASLIPADGQPLPPRLELRPGVIAVVGYANRFLIVAYCVWVMVVAGHALYLRRRQSRYRSVGRSRHAGPSRR